MTNSNLSSCASLPLVAQKQCYWNHLTLGNPLILPACYALFAVTYLLCVWKVYRDHPHTKQDWLMNVFVTNNWQLGKQLIERERTLASHLLKHDFRHSMECFLLSIPTNPAMFSSRKHIPQRSRPLTATADAPNPRERLPQCSEEASRRQTKATRPRRRQTLPTSEENDPCRGAARFIQCSLLTVTLWFARIAPCASVLITYVAVWASFQRSWSGVQPSSIFPKRLEVSEAQKESKTLRKEVRWAEHGECLHAERRDSRRNTRNRERSGVTQKKGGWVRWWEVVFCREWDNMILRITEWNANNGQILDCEA